MSKKLKKDFKFWLNVLTFIALLALVLIARNQILEAFKKLGDLNASALLLMIPLQALSYYAVARLYKDYFKTQGEDLPLKKMYAIALEMNFVNHVFPSGGVSGFSYLSLRLKQEGISTAKSTLAQILRFGLTFVSFLGLLFIGMLMLALQRHTSPLTILVASTITFFTFFGVIVAGYIISDEKRIKSFVSFLPKAVNRVAGRLRPQARDIINITRVEHTLTDLHNDFILLAKDWKQLSKPFWWALLTNVCEVLTIYVVYMAFGELINPGALILAYAVANFAGLVAILPGGVGIYEGLMTATLTSAGIDKALALSATVVYRVLSLIVFLPIGYVLYQRVLKRTGKNIVEEAVDADIPNLKD